MRICACANLSCIARVTPKAVIMQEQGRESARVVRASQRGLRLRVLVLRLCPRTPTPPSQKHAPCLPRPRALAGAATRAMWVYTL